MIPVCVFVEFWRIHVESLWCGETLVAEFQMMPLVQLFEMASIKIADLKKQVSLAALVDGQRSLLSTTAIYFCFFNFDIIVNDKKTRK